MLLQNDSIYLRAVEISDLDFLYRWENDTSLWSYGSTIAPFSKATLQTYIEETQKYTIFQTGQLRLIICSIASDKVLGAIDLFDLDVYHSKVGVGILVDEIYRNQDIASQSLELIQEYCFNFLYLHQIFAHIARSNRISIALFEKVGFTKTAELKDWMKVQNGFEDVFLMQLINGRDNIR